ncbi:hypothetical protein D3C71_2186770 [compost metagenome]
MLDAVFVALLEKDNMDPKLISDQYNKLILDKNFISSSIGPTADTSMLKQRIQIAKNYFG